MGELIVRYGWPEAWTQPFPRPLSAEPPPVMGHEPSPSFWFFATPTFPPRADDDSHPVEWDLMREQPVARYAPLYARAFGGIARAQLARFRRGGGAVTVAAYDLRGDTLTVHPGLRIALAASRDPATPPAVGRDAQATAGVLTLETPWMPSLVSLEARVPDDRRAARARVLAADIESPSVLALSDLLLSHVGPDGDGGADSLGAVTPRALLAPELRAGSPVGLFWEIYGVQASERVRVEVSAERAGKARLDWALLGTHTCGGAERRPVRIAWEEAASSVPRPPGRFVVLDLSHLAPARYRLSVAVSAGGGAAACTAREVEIRKP